ncbi:hypothetical protein CQA72_29690, partial [Klebsiella pneumoniae]
AYYREQYCSLAGAGQVLTVTDSLPSTLPAPIQGPDAYYREQYCSLAGAGQVLTVTDSLPSTLPAPIQG